MTCIECHGLSAAHANDEDIGATKPDIVYRRDQIDAMCRKCHTEHDVLPRDVIARFLERKLTVSPAVCTDCHGKHRIEAAEWRRKSGEGEEGEEMTRRAGGRGIEAAEAQTWSSGRMFAGPGLGGPLPPPHSAVQSTL